ncbi:MAG: hypothetical protein GXY27_03095 [Erysipelotrichaceae bacterium]|jgi:hypothetical protein|nr:hypothetical protein [Erysipelotrichaceae bacterium]
MSYKIGLILSMIFVALFFLFGADLIGLQSAYSALDAKANNISYLIARNGVINENFINSVESSFNVDFLCDTNLAPEFGEKISFTIVSTYQPLIIDKKEMVIAITRMTIVGFYG